MKKIIAIALVLIMVFAFAGCAGGNVSTGVGVQAATSKSISAAQDKAGAWVAGTVQFSVTVVAVSLSGDKVVGVSIDAVQPTASFDQGGLPSNKTTDAAVQTKREKGDAYGMKASSGLGMEWWEQADALEAWMVGKTVDTVLAMAVAPASSTKPEPGAPTGDDLKSSVSISCTDILKAFKKAADVAMAK
jgi:hypothetical protein